MWRVSPTIKIIIDSTMALTSWQFSISPTKKLNELSKRVTKRKARK